MHLNVDDTRHNVDRDVFENDVVISENIKKYLFRHGNKNVKGVTGTCGRRNAILNYIILYTLPRMLYLLVPFKLHVTRNVNDTRGVAWQFIIFVP